MTSIPRPFSALLPAVCVLLLATLPSTSRAKGPKAESTPAPTPETYVYAYSGEQEIDGPTGSDYIRFFTPEVGFFLSDVTPPKKSGSNSDTLDVGGLDSDYPNAILTGLTQPTGEGLIATFKPGVGGLKASNNSVMLFGDLDYAPDIDPIAQTGTPEADLPDGVTIKKFLTLDAEGVPFFFATLQGTGVSGSNSLALCTFNYDYDFIARNTGAPGADPQSLSFYGSPLIILARVGDSVLLSDSETKIIKTITTLVGSKGTLADGRWRTLYYGEGEFDEIGVLITFTDGTQAIYTIPTYAEENPSEWTFLAQSGFVTDLDDESYTIQSFGLPAFDYEDFAVLANLKLGTVIESGTPVALAAVKPKAKSVVKPASLLSSTTVTSSNDVVLLYGDEFGDGYTIMAEKGDTVPYDSDGNTLTGVTLSNLSDPVVGDNGSVAYMVKMSGAQAPATGIEFYDNNYEDGPYLLADSGGTAPDVTGTGAVGKWASFTSLVLPSFVDFEDEQDQLATAHPAVEQFSLGGDIGPIFVATLKIDPAHGVNASNNVGIWALDGYDILQLIFRTGQTVQVNGVNKVVKSFKALDAAPGSVGAVHGYDDYGDVAAVATFTDGSTALLVFSIPEDER